MLLHVAIAKGSWQFHVSQRQTTTSPIKLDHTFLQMVTDTVKKPTASDTMTRL